MKADIEDVPVKIGTVGLVFTGRSIRPLARKRSRAFVSVF